MTKKLKKADGCIEEECSPATINPAELNQLNIRTLCIIGEINHATLAMFAGPFLSLDEEKGPIKLKICSNGGDIPSGLAIYDLLCSSKNKIITEGFGVVQSIATCIFQAGHIRKLHENCHFMAHSAKATIPFPMSPREIAIENKELTDWNNIILKILKSRSKLKKDDLERILTQDVYLTAKETLNLGLCDLILKNKSRKL